MTSDPGEHERVVVVLGFHRSGTSMVTRMLNLLGVDLGDEAKLLPPEERDNARGYWEPEWMNALNEELLETLGSGTFAPFDPEPGWERSAELEPLRERARELLADHFGSAPVWGWKDPRTSLTLPFWREVLDRPISAVVCVRSPADAVASALKRGVDNLHRWSYAERWLDYTSAALANTSPQERIVVFYEDALRDPTAETQRLAAFLDLPSPPREQMEATAASVDPELRHHMTSPLDVAVDPGLPLATRALYLLLRARRDVEAVDAERPSSTRLVPAIDRVGEHLREDYYAAVRVQGAERRALLEVEARDARLAEAGERERELMTRLAAAEQVTAELQERERAREELMRSTDALALERAEAIADREARIAELDGALAALNEEVARRDATIETYAGSLSWKVTRPLRAVGQRVRVRGR